MNKSNSKTRSLLIVRAFALTTIAAALGAAGCAATPLEQAVAADSPAAWSSKIQSLPVEVHGSVPGETAAQTIAAIDHGTAGEDGTESASLWATPRVIVYIGGTEAPARDQYCALDPDTNRSVATTHKGVIIREELCDGPRPVAYARSTLFDENPTAEAVARSVEQVKSNLVDSLKPSQIPFGSLPQYQN
jgi:hypothetical protein